MTDFKSRDYKYCHMKKLGFFSEALAEGMVRQGLTEKRLALRVGCSYEHIRKMLKSEALPSLPLLQRLCSVLALPERKLRRFALIDRMRKEFGDAFWSVLGIDPKCADVYILWEFLSEQERDYFTSCLRLLATRRTDDPSTQNVA